MQPPAEPDIVLIISLFIVGFVSLSSFIGLIWMAQDAFRSNAKLVETNRVLALGYANPDAALRLVARDQANGKDAKTKAAINQIRLAQTRNARALAERNAAGRSKPPREAPSLKYHNAVDDDLVPPEPKDKK
jgi:hypothetical protein